MELQKPNVKFFAAGPDRVPLTTFIDLFHSWIQATDGIYYDVADYSHMVAGPGIVLVAHEANISIDETEGRRGLLYNRKQPLPGSNRERLNSVFRSALDYCRRIEEEQSVRGKIKFLGNEAHFLINDRLQAPNAEKTFDAVKSDLEDLARTMYRGAGFTLEHDAQERRKRFSVRLRTPVHFEVEALLNNLNDRAVADTAGRPAT